MLKKIVILVLFLSLSNFELKAKTGQGDIKLSPLVLNSFLDYLAGEGNPKATGAWNKFGRPQVFVVSPSGRFSFYYYCPQKAVAQTRCGPALQMAPEAKRKCKKNAKKRGSDERCFTFAKGRKIIWGSINYTIDKKMSREEARDKLIELNLVQGLVPYSKKNITNQLKDLKDLYDSGSLTKEQYENAKKKLLN